VTQSGGNFVNGRSVFMTVIGDVDDLIGDLYAEGFLSVVGSSVSGPAVFANSGPTTKSTDAKQYRQYRDDYALTR